MNFYAFAPGLESARFRAIFSPLPVRHTRTSKNVFFTGACPPCKDITSDIHSGYTRCIVDKLCRVHLREREGKVVSVVSYGIMAQKRHRHLPSPAQEWFRLHFQPSGFNGRFQIGIRRPEFSSILPLTTQPMEHLPDFIASAHFSRRLDYYITANSFSGVKRQKNDLFSLHNIVIDIDAHIEEFTPDADESNDEQIFSGDEPKIEQMFFDDEPLHSFLNRLREFVSDNEDIPSPTSVVWTGRGLQLWWAIIPMSKKCLTWYEEIRDALLLRIQDLIDDYPDELEGLKVDCTSSRNVVGYFRLPGTVNSRSQTVVKPEIWAGLQYDTHQMIKWAKRYVSERAKESSETQVHTNADDTFNYSDVEVRILKNMFTFAFFRVRQIIRLRALRNDEIGDETRNNMCLIVYNAFLLAHGAEKAWEKILDFNAGFKKPMTEKELHNSLDTSMRVGGYRYKNETVISFLGITEYEQNQIELFPGGSTLSRLSSHPSRTASRRLAKQHRNKKVLELSASGKKKKEIAEELSISLNTVTSILGARKPRREEALELKKAGMTTSEISAELGVSKRTVERYLEAVETSADSSEPGPDEPIHHDSDSAGNFSTTHTRSHRVPRIFRRRNAQRRDPSILPKDQDVSPEESDTDISDTS